MTSTNALDDAAESLLQALTLAAIQPDARNRAGVDAAIKRLHRLMQTRLQSMIRLFGLSDHSDDAEQAALVAMVEAVRRWDPSRSGFGTWLGWQWRGTLIGLRRQLQGDGRTGSGRQRRATLLLSSLTKDEGALLLADLADPDAEAAVERGASDWLAQRTAAHLLAERKARQPLSRDRRRLLAAMARGERRYCSVT